MDICIKNLYLMLTFLYFFGRQFVLYLITSTTTFWLFLIIVASMLVYFQNFFVMLHLCSFVTWGRAHQARNMSTKQNIFKKVISLFFHHCEVNNHWNQPLDLLLSDLERMKLNCKKIWKISVFCNHLKPIKVYFEPEFFKALTVCKRWAL